MSFAYPLLLSLFALILLSLFCFVVIKVLSDDSKNKYDIYFITPSGDLELRWGDVTNVGRSGGLIYFSISEKEEYYVPVNQYMIKKYAIKR